MPSRKNSKTRKSRGTVDLPPGSISIAGPLESAADRLKSDCEQFQTSLRYLSSNVEDDLINSEIWRSRVYELSQYIQAAMGQLTPIASSTHVQAQTLSGASIRLSKDTTDLDLLLHMGKSHRIYEGLRATLNNRYQSVKIDLEELLSHAGVDMPSFPVAGMGIDRHRAAYSTRVISLAGQAHDDAMRTIKSIWAYGANPGEGTWDELESEIMEADVMALSIFSLSEGDLADAETREMWAAHCQDEHIYLLRFNPSWIDTQKCLAAFTTDMLSLAHVLTSKDMVTDEVNAGMRTGGEYETV